MVDNSKISPWMYRVRGETSALIISILTTLIFGWLFSLWNIWLLVGIVIVGLIYVRLQQAQYLGNAVRVHAVQFSEIHSLFVAHAQKLRIERASLYIAQDPYLQAITLGINHCTVVLTSALVEQLTLQELSFVIGHELGHFACGHTKITTLINPLGGNAVGNFLFSIWNRKAEYTSDRCGVVLTKDINSAISALLKIAIGGSLFKELDFKGYLAQMIKAQGREVVVGEMLLSHPLITNRIKSLYTFWKENFVKYDKGNIV